MPMRDAQNAGLPPYQRKLARTHRSSVGSRALFGNRNTLPTHLFLPKTLGFLFIIMLYFNSYRYPFQIGDTLTSSTYEDTPVWIQVTKYVLLSLALFAVFCTIKINKSISSDKILLGLLGVFLCLQSFLMMSEDFATGSRIFEIGFFTIFAFVFSINTLYREASFKLFGYLKFFYFANLVAYVIQLYLFYFEDRLPALGYEGGVSRFGGMWDDPNSALAPFILFTPYLFATKGISKESVASLILLIVALALSQSGTSLIGLAVSVVLIFVFFLNRMSNASKRNFILIGSVTALSFTILIFLALYLTNAVDFSRYARDIDDFMRMKSESASMRLYMFELLSNMNFGTFIGINPVLGYSENEFINILVNSGIFVLLMFLTIIGMTLRNLYVWTKVAKSKREYAIVVSFAAYFIWYATSMFNIPIAEVYPANLIAAVISGLSFSAHFLNRNVQRRRSANHTHVAALNARQRMR